MRSSTFLPLAALAALTLAAPALAEDGQRGGWGPGGWRAGADVDAPLPPGHPPVHAGEPIPADHPPVMRGPINDHDGDFPPPGMRDGRGRGPMVRRFELHREGPMGPPPGRYARGGDGYYYVEPDGAYYYVPDDGGDYYQGYAEPRVYTNPHGPITVAPGTTVIVKVQPTVTRTVTEEWVTVPAKRHWAPKVKDKRLRR